ncbi:MAG: hypothetical protein CR972_04280 [Candidatus Moraniibacteriota bacterium]|nr:MAG: hypothetical protein CR972_04280 [Candidatus Moranbacteria bacterium]
METLEINTFIVIAGIIAIGLFLAPFLQIAWGMRVLIASYISTCLVLLMPNAFAFNSYVNAVYFCCITIIFAIVAKKQFFDVSEWSVGRFSLQSFGFSVLVWIFIVAALCMFLPFSLINLFFTKEVYDILVEYIFYFAVAPIMFTVLFSKYAQ